MLLLSSAKGKLQVILVILALGSSPWRLAGTIHVEQIAMVCWAIPVAMSEEVMLGNSSSSDMRCCQSPAQNTAICAVPAL